MYISSKSVHNQLFSFLHYRYRHCKDGFTSIGFQQTTIPKYHISTKSFLQDLISSKGNKSSSIDIKEYDKY